VKYSSSEDKLASSEQRTTPWCSGAPCLGGHAADPHRPCLGGGAPASPTLLAVAVLHPLRPCSPWRRSGLSDHASHGGALASLALLAVVVLRPLLPTHRGGVPVDGACGGTRISDLPPGCHTPKFKKFECD
jgi:hypothetical protein